MPKLRRLNGSEVIAILEQFGFVVIRIRGSHYRLKRDVSGKSEYLMVPVHGSKPLAIGTLRSIVRQAGAYIDKETLEAQFFTD
jgi:predicted RNA binding protein YcfA (HicA-like mRNA interferase family)